MPKSQERDLLNEEISVKFQKALSEVDGFYFKWNGLDKIGKVYSENNKLRIYTWYLQTKNDDYQYYGFIQYNNGKRKKGKEEILIYTLKDNSSNMKNPVNQSFIPENWYGSLYFNMKSFVHKRKVYYMLMGYDFNDSYSQKKILEVLTFSKKGEAVFSGNFDSDYEKQKRIIFEYSNNVAMSLNYNDRLEMIIFDHLAPLQPIFFGSYRFYGPDGSYDGLKFNKTIFHLKKEVDARNK